MVFKLTQYNMPTEQFATHLKHAGRAALNLLLPPLCLACDAPVIEQGGICAACWGQLRFVTDPLCPVCGAPYELPRGDLACTACLTKPPRYQAARAAVIYDRHSRGLILGLKHADQTHAVPALAQMMLRAGQKQLTDCAWLAPVPLHRWRLFRRQYNQAAMLARALGGLAGLPVLQDLLIRRRATAPQGRKNAAQRARNVRGAFAFNMRHHAAIAGQTIGLLDDVLTTGATVNECAQTLIAHGAAGVKVFTFARTENR